MNREQFLNKVYSYPKSYLVGYMWEQDYSGLFDATLVQGLGGKVHATEGNKQTVANYIVLYNDLNATKYVDKLEDTISNIDVKTYFSDFESEDYEKVLDSLAEYGGEL